MRMTPEAFIALSRQPTSATAFRLGTIPADHVAGPPRVQFDGESVAGTRLYPHMSDYAPAASDRVLVALVGHGGVILGRITSP